MVKRMFRALTLDASVYEEVEHDQNATGSAALVVILSSLAAGVGSINVLGSSGILIGTIVALASWFLWSLLTYVIGARVLPTPETEANLGQLLRTLGYASAPGVIRVLGILGSSVLGFVILMAVIWSLAAMVIAVRQALDYKSTWRAIAVVLIAGMIQGFILFLVDSLLRNPQAS